MPVPAPQHRVHLRRSPLLITLALLYLGALFFLTMLPASRPVAQYHNLVPLKSIIFDLQRGGQLLLVNVIGNIIAFMPVGLLVPQLSAWRRGWLAVAVSALVLSTSIEVLQRTLTRRVSDIDDVLLNVSGALLGYGLFLVVSRLWPRHHSQIN